MAGVSPFDDRNPTPEEEADINSITQFVTRAGGFSINKEGAALVRTGLLFHALARLQHSNVMTSLTIMECGLSVVPTVLADLPSLKRLCLRNNKLTSLPAVLFFLPRLKVLDVSFNRLEEIPTFGYSPKLKRFDVSANLLREFPWWSFTMSKKIETVYLSENKINLVTVPDYARPYSLALCNGIQYQYVPQNIAYGIFLGSVVSSKDQHLLESLGIKKVIAVGVKTWADKTRFDCYEFEMADDPAELINALFPIAIRIIDECVRQWEGVLVHCAAGISRSAAIVCAYLMFARGVSMEEALDTVRQQRYIANPNHGFQRQLTEFDFASLRRSIKPAIFR